MTCVDGFVAAVPTANKEARRRHAEEAAKMFTEYGALSLVECWGNDGSEGEPQGRLHLPVSRPEQRLDRCPKVMAGCIR